jgi:hypothetical protein
VPSTRSDAFADSDLLVNLTLGALGSSAGSLFIDDLEVTRPP